MSHTETSSDDDSSVGRHSSSDDDSSSSTSSGTAVANAMANLSSSSSSSGTTLANAMANLSSTSEDSSSASKSSSSSSEEEDLHDAVEMENVETVSRMISEKVDLNDCGGGCCPPLHSAVKSKNTEIVKLLVDAGADVNAINLITKETPLHLAIKVISFEIVRMLLVAGAEVNAKDQEEFTPLHLAAKYKNLKIFTLLLKAGANINAKSKSRMTPLHFAAVSGRINILKQLLDSGAEVNVRNSERQTPLHQAALGLNGVNVFRLLFDAGANTNVCDGEKYTPFVVLALQMSDTKSTKKNSLAEKSLRLIIDYTDVNLTNRKNKNVICSLLKTSSLKVSNKIVIEHIAKMNSLDMHLDPRLLEAISNRSELSEYYKACVEELKQAKSIKLNKCWVTFFNLLLDDERKLVKYAGNKDLTTEINETKLDDKFPIFGVTMQTNVAKGVNGRKLFDGAADALNHCVPIFSPTHLVIRDVLDAVSEEDWKSLGEKKRRRN